MNPVATRRDFACPSSNLSRPTMTRENPDRLALLCREIAVLIGRPSIDPRSSVAELGMDSLFVSEILLVCEEIYGRRIDYSKIEIDEKMTIEDLERHIQAQCLQ
jgi:acyl carrier protein